MYTPKNPREHTSLLISLGRIFPISKAQAKKVIKAGFLDVLTYDEADFISDFMERNGQKAEFTLTKSKSFKRLSNFEAFAKSLKSEYKF